MQIASFRDKPRSHSRIILSQAQVLKHFTHKPLLNPKPEPLNLNPTPETLNPKYRKNIPHLMSRCCPELHCSIQCTATVSATPKPCSSWYQNPVY